jgi:hypothetical protein
MSCYDPVSLLVKGYSAIFNLATFSSDMVCKKKIGGKNCHALLTNFEYCGSRPIRLEEDYETSVRIGGRHIRPWNFRIYAFSQFVQ